MYAAYCVASGVKVGSTTSGRFGKRVHELVVGYENLQLVFEGLLSVHAVLLREFQTFDKQVRGLARQDEKARHLMTTPGVGPIVALTYASAIDDPGRFSLSKQVGAHFGLTPRWYQSSETDYSGRISKSGDAAVRARRCSKQPTSY